MHTCIHEKVMYLSTRTHSSHSHACCTRDCVSLTHTLSHSRSLSLSLSLSRALSLSLSLSLSDTLPPSVLFPSSTPSLPTLTCRNAPNSRSTNKWPSYSTWVAPLNLRCSSLQFLLRQLFRLKFTIATTTPTPATMTWQWHGRVCDRV